MKNIQKIITKVDTKLNSTTSKATFDVLCIYNPDGNIRWIWHAECKQPLFLKFYHVQGFKAKVFVMFIKWIFKLQLQKRIFTSTKVTSFNPILARQNWALFTGTQGPNQKLILYHNSADGKNGVFTKIALEEKSKILIQHEVKAIENLRQKNELGFSFPNILAHCNHTVAFKEDESFMLRQNVWTSHHTNMMKTLSHINANTISFNEFDTIHNLNQRINILKQSRRKLPSGIIKKLEYLYLSLSGTTVETHLTHGDFTPWNTYSNSKGELLVYDWELGRNYYPLGFDYFHFIIQNGVLTQHLTWHEINQQIIQTQLEIFNDVPYKKYLALYLLTNVLNHLELYEAQKDWHVQVRWLLNLWSIAMGDMLTQYLSKRELIVLDCFDQLHFNKYAGLKLNDEVEKVSEYADIDILLERQTSKQLIHFLKHHPLVQKIHLQNESALTKVMLITNDNEILSMDHIFKLQRKSKTYMRVSDLIEHAHIDKNGIKKVNGMHTLQFIGMFYGLNNASIPKKYRANATLFFSGNPKLDYIINKQFISGVPRQKELYSLVNKLPCNQHFEGFKNKVYYFFNVIKKLITQKGLVITFSGVDGAGKTTVIENIKFTVEKKMRKEVVVIRHRPSVLPILSAWTKGKLQAEVDSINSLPREGKNKSVLSSLLRFTYYYSDYLFGQFYIYIKYVLRGKVVLYDRYYFDFINDSLRSNIILPKWFLRIGYALLIKPDLNFFLYAEAKTILARKKELSEATIIELTNDYLGLFKDLGHKHINQYQAIENVYLEHTISHISSSIQYKLI